MDSEYYNNGEIIVKFHYSLKSTKNYNYNKEIFKSYPDPTYIAKLTKLNRPLLEVVTDTDELAALAVMRKHERFMKLCLLIVDVRFRKYDLGNKLIRIVQSIFNDEWNAVDVLYTVCPHQFNTDNYQNILIKNGFQVSTIKANGDIVYTYAKSI